MSRRTGQRGLTLLEILLVLALLVIVGAVVAPTIARFSQTQKLRDSANLIRGEWARARVQAMKSGRIHVFRYEQEGTHYVVDFWMAEDDGLEAGDDSALTEDSAATATAANVPWEAEELPAGVNFLLGSSEVAAREDQIAEELESAPSSGGSLGWSPPVLFYSDGTTSSADVVLANRHNNAIRISLRGLTGIASVSEVFSLTGEAEGGTP